MYIVYDGLCFTIWKQRFIRYVAQVFCKNHEDELFTFLATRLLASTFGFPLEGVVVWSVFSSRISDIFYFLPLQFVFFSRNSCVVLSCPIFSLPGFNASWESPFPSALPFTYHDQRTLFVKPVHRQSISPSSPPKFLLTGMGGFLPPIVGISRNWVQKFVPTDECFWGEFPYM